MDKNTNLLNKLCQMNAIQLLYADMEKVKNIFKNAPYLKWMEDSFDKFVRDFKRFGQFLDKDDLYELRESYRQYYCQLVSKMGASEHRMFEKTHSEFLEDLEESFEKEDGNTVR